MKGAEYWKRRFFILEEARHEAAERTLAEVEGMFRSAQRELEGQAAAWYARFADNNGISLQQARGWLDGGSLAELKWDVDAYIRYGEENAIDQRWMRELENASGRFHIRKIEALELQTRQTLEALQTGQQDAMGRLLKRQYLDGYHHTCYEVQKGLGVGWDIAGIDEGRLGKVLAKPWTADGRTFSDRIWMDKNRLLDRVHTELTRNMILGKGPDGAIRSVAKAMDASRSHAGRLVMTESAYFGNLAQRDAYKELGVERYRVLETLDGQTCELCGAMDGKAFGMGEFAVGATAPPFHPWCRGCTAPEYEGAAGERAARGADGETVYVDGDVGYGEWKDRFVDGEIKINLNVNNKNIILNNKKIINESPSKKLNRYPVTQKQIDDILCNELKNIQFPVKPVYNPRIRANGITKGEMYSWGQLKKIESIQIGKQDSPSKEYLIDTLLHEYYEAEIMSRQYGEKFYNDLNKSGDIKRHAWINKQIERFFNNEEV